MRASCEPSVCPFCPLVTAASELDTNYVYKARFCFAPLSPADDTPSDADAAPGSLPCCLSATVAAAKLAVCCFRTLECVLFGFLPIPQAPAVPSLQGRQEPALPRSSCSGVSCFARTCEQDRKDVPADTRNLRAPVGG